MWNEAVIERFWSKVDKNGECWQWTAATIRGHGTVWMTVDGRNKQMYAHRVAFILHHGAISDGAQIDHICRNRGCVRPDHLREATNKQNAENLSPKGQGGRSGVRGVAWHGQAGKWWAVVRHNGKQFSGGLHSTVESAEAAVIELRNRIHTHNEADRQLVGNHHPLGWTDAAFH